jgi:hypothetical protein
MGGLEPRAPYMRSSEIDWTDPCSIRVFGPLSRFLPIVLPTEDRVKNRLDGDLCLLPKVVRDLDIQVLRRANVGMADWEALARWLILY